MLQNFQPRTRHKNTEVGIPISDIQMSQPTGSRHCPFQKHTVMGFNPVSINVRCVESQRLQNRKTQKDSSHSVYSQQTGQPLRPTPDSPPCDNKNFVPPDASYTSKCHPAKWRWGGAVSDQPILPELPPRGKHGNQVKSVQSSHPSSIFGFFAPKPSGKTAEICFCTCHGC